MQSYFKSVNASQYSCLFRPFHAKSLQCFPSIIFLRLRHDDGRRRLSAFWIPSGGISHDAETQEDSHSLLVRGGFLRQAHSGLFQFLPLGLRVQEKIERLLDKHMSKIGASKLSLSTFSSEEIWRKSGRLSSAISRELFRLKDRKETEYLLSPTYEEEITALVSDTVKSYKELPLRLYQITRKYRDEPRPRQGLLRTREFLMKDLYTFDESKSKALQTYETVRNAYSAFFNEFKIPYLAAEASSGDMGGALSHEYHFPTTIGEDNLVHCTSCSYVANEEVAGSEDRMVTRQLTSPKSLGDVSDFRKLNSTCNTFYGISKHRHILFKAMFPKHVEIATNGETFFRETEANHYVLKEIVPQIDFSAGNPVEAFTDHVQQYSRIVSQDPHTPIRKPCLISIFDYRIPKSVIESYMNGAKSDQYPEFGSPVQFELKEDNKGSLGPNLVRIQPGDPCTKCSTGILKFQTAAELGHTFHLGTRYSKPLEAIIAIDPNRPPNTDPNNLDIVNDEPLQDSPQRSTHQPRAYLQMGCHGIGVSRLIAATADSLADSSGLNWPRAIAPFETVIVPTTKALEPAAIEIYDLLSASVHGESAIAGRAGDGVDAILDDREHKDLGWKLKDADLVGYPVIVVIGRGWRAGRRCEVQCRRLGGLKVEVGVEELRGKVVELLDRL